MKTANAHVTYETHHGNARHDAFTSAGAAGNAAPGIYPLTVYYESACALCNAEMTNLMLRNTDGLLVFADVSAPGFSDFPGGATMQEMLELIHARTADGRVLNGVPVFELAYRAVGLGWISSAMRLPVLRSVAAWGYPVLARNRRRIPRGLVGWVLEGAVRRAAEKSAAVRCDSTSCAR